MEKPGIPLSAEEHAQSMTHYAAQGVQRALALGNRGPIEFGEDGQLAAHIFEAYWRTGFYVFENLIAEQEITELREEMAQLLEQAPVDNGAPVDRQGRPAFGQGFAKPVYSLVRPLSDPWGGTQALNGRHPTQMHQPRPSMRDTGKVVFIMSGMCQTMASGLRLYGHPALLATAASINGDDFVPFNDATFIKQPGVGASVSWHQDGVTHWNNRDWDEGIHGFNFQVQLYDTSANSSLWVTPGTHKLGKIDIRERVAANGGSDQLPQAVPLFCRAGDVTIVNRQALHASFANTSEDLRISLTFGFHRRASVLGASGALGEAGSICYDEERIHRRSEVIGIAIDARHQYYPHETPFRYRPLAAHQEAVRFNEANWQRIVKDYNLWDLSI